jgi:CheY-like chemotaxis protein
VPRPNTLESCSKFLAGKRVLIVDDDEDSRTLLRFVLESCEMDVHDSESVDDALPALDHARFDVIISDIGMPGRDGYSLIRAVRGRRESAALPAVALTAFARAEDRSRALRAGFDLHMGKPFDSLTLIQAVVALVAGARNPR